ncbi:MAG: hypothetical protein M3548_00510 [Actinomycetota bacterium]|nr:hypothetical protein [Actinomycetota bacterium]
MKQRKFRLSKQPFFGVSVQNKPKKMGPPCLGRSGVESNSSLGVLPCGLEYDPYAFRGHFDAFGNLLNDALHVVKFFQEVESAFPLLCDTLRGIESDEFRLF